MRPYADYAQLLKTLCIVCAETIKLKSGEVYEGVITDRNEKYVTLQTGGAPIYLSADQIDEITESSSVKAESPQISAEKTTEKVNVPSKEASLPKEYSQKDGLFKLNIPDDWQGKEMPGTVIIVPPWGGGGIVIKFQSVSASLTQDQIKTGLASSLEDVVKNKIETSGGSVIENKEITIDNVYGRSLFYNVSFNDERMYFIRILFVNKGYSFSIDYGGPSKEDAENVVRFIETFKFL